VIELLFGSVDISTPIDRRDGQCGPGDLGNLAPSRLMSTPDWDAIERQYRAGQLSIKELARQHKLSDTAIHKRAKAKGWTRDLSGAVRTRVRESLVCDGR
jgi:hypothetical protein